MQVFQNEGLQLLQTTAQALENYSFLLFFSIVAALIATLDHIASTTRTAMPCASRSHPLAIAISMTRPGPDPAQTVRRRCSSPAASRSQFQFECCKRTPVQLIRFRFICKKTSLGGRKQKEKKKRGLIFRRGFVRNLRTMLCMPLNMYIFE